MKESGNVLTVHLMGGLGNQLFQYAFGRRLALVNNARLYLDASGYGHAVEADPVRGIRRCDIGHFNIAANIIVGRTNQGGMQTAAKRLWDKAFRRFVALIELSKPYYARREIVEPAGNRFRFDRRVHDRRIRGPISVRGFWQSERYFLEIESVLHRELTLRQQLAPTKARLAEAIETSMSVGIHVRHGDNATAVASNLGLLPRDYYAEALSAIRREVRDLLFFVFSDDLAWARLFLGDIGPAYFVEHNGQGKDPEDLHLLSLCKHHVLANSTFGWWGAWLGRKDGQIVYAPRRYYQNVDQANPDLYPADWRLI